ncbi:MAG: hypothetical protein HY545_00680 [Candidatus Doudnabacteria bacterium]|nr:hypothetical protein [Candidatus Doudnabacteria bacterium]
MTIEQINKLTIDQLLEPKVIEQVEKLAADSMFDFEPGMAQEFFFAVNDLMSKYKDDLKGKPQIRERYFKISLALFWKGFQAIGKGYKKEYVTKHLVASLNNGIDVLSGIKKYLSVFEYNFVIDAELRSELLFSLNNNEERLGNEMIELKTGEEAPPSVKNWIKNYVSFLPEGRVLSSSFDKINYLTGSPNVKRLPARDKEILSKIIDIFGFLKSPLEKSGRVGLELKTIAPAVLKAPPPPLKPSPIFSKPAAVPGKVMPTKPIPPPPPPPRPQPQPMAVKHGLSLEQLKKEVTPLDYKEIKREVDMPELVAHKEVKLPVAAVFDDRTKVAPSEIKVIDDLKKLDVGYLRRADLRTQISNLKSQILRLAAINHLYPYQVVMAFEQSPLFKLYLSHGSSRVIGQPSKDDLSQAEFEALADLRKEIERL